MVIEKKNIIIVLLVVLALFTSFAQSETLFHGLTTAKRLYFFSIMSAIFLSLAFILLFRKNSIRISVNYLDISLLLFLTYSFIRLLFTGYVSLSGDQFISLVLLTCFYFVVKNVAVSSTNKDVLVTGFLIAGFLQGLYGLAQLYGLFPSNNQYFKITGSFGNPDAFAGYIVSTLPISLGVYLSDEAKHKFSKVQIRIGIVTFLVLSLVLAASRIRGGWLAAIIGCGFILYSKYNTNIKKIIKNKLRIAVILISGIVLMALFVLFLYNLKPDSANGRILIWKISLPMVLENPLFGIGFNRFQVEYNNRQADYFASGLGNDYEEFIAGNVNRAHNEYIEILVELGIIGLFLFLFILYTAFITKIRKTDKVDDNKLLFLVKISIAAILLFSFTSFPMHIIPTQINLFFLLGIISSYHTSAIKVELQSNITKYLVAVFTCLTLLLGYHVSQNYYTYKRWSEAVHLSLSSNYLFAQSIFAELYPTLKDDGEYLLNYGGTLNLIGNQEKAIVLLEEAKKRFTDPQLYINLGNSYAANGEAKNAEKNYLHAIHMVPHKFYAKYLLAKYYYKINYLEKMTALGKEILSMKEKTESLAVKQIKNEVKALLDNKKLTRQ